MRSFRLQIPYRKTLYPCKDNHFSISGCDVAKEWVKESKKFFENEFKWYYFGYPM